MQHFESAALARANIQALEEHIARANEELPTGCISRWFLSASEKALERAKAAMLGEVPNLSSALHNARRAHLFLNSATQAYAGRREALS